MGTISQAERDKMPAEDFAGPHQSFPIRNQQDVEDAARLIGHAADPEAVKRRILAICKRLGLDPPEAWETKPDNEMTEPAGKKNAELWITTPIAAKAMGGGKVGGYVVRWGSEATKDAEGEWFTPETDFDTEFPARASVYYNHCMDPVIRNRRLAHGSLKRDEFGVWVEAQLDLQDRYQRFMYQRASDR